MMEDFCKGKGLFSILNSKKELILILQENKRQTLFGIESQSNKSKSCERQVAFYDSSHGIKEVSVEFKGCPSYSQA